MTRHLLASLALASAALASPASAQWTTEAVLAEMGTFIGPCVQPTAGPRVFTRCFDTHSSVHAHWAAYRIARFLPSMDQLALDSELALEPAKIAVEVRDHVTYPYAEAWFLLLGIDYELWATDRGRPAPLRLRRAGSAVADRILARYEAVAPNPRTPEYSNASWHLLQTHRWYEHVNDAAKLARVDALIQQHFLGPIGTPTLRSNIGNPNQFFSIHGNWVHLVMETQDAATVRQFVLDQGTYPHDHLEPNPIGPMVHSYGMGWSRAWALRTMGRHAPDPFTRWVYGRAAEAHVAAGMARHPMLMGNFGSYSHWVPQFAVYAVTDGL